MRAIHVVQLGLLEGTKEFGKDAGIRAFYDIIRVAAVFLFVYLGLKIIGVIYGFIFASLCILIIGWYCVKNLRTQGEKKLKWRDIASFSLPIIVFAVVYTAIMNIDILFVKSLITGSKYTGYYTSAWAIARVPFYIFSALFFTIVPSISRSRAEDNLQQTQDYISHSLRYYSMIVIPIAFLTLATAPALLSFLFTPEYGVAGDTLRILIFGMSFFAAFIIMSMILIGAGKPFIPMVIGVILLPIDIILSYIFVLTWGPNGAALSLAIVALIGMCIVAVYILIKFEVLMKISTFVKVVGASLAVFCIAYWLQLEGFLLIGLYAGLFILYFIILYIVREIKEQDIKLVKGLFLE